MSTDETKTDDSNRVKIGFGKLLNAHGYGFQYSVLKLADELCHNGNSSWVFEASEFPVQVQNEGTRIDFVLRLKSNSIIYFVAECKKANQAFSNWCFCKAPYIRRNRKTNEPLLIEYLQEDTSGSFYASAQARSSLKDAYHIALEVKSNEKGDPIFSGKDEIEKSATQICRGLNGFVEFTAKNKQILYGRNNAYFLPVIFTTAKIWASDVNLSSTDIMNGKVSLDGTAFIEKPWIFYQYHLSPGIKHSHPPTKRGVNIGDILDSEYIRSIVIVTASGITDFLKWSSDLDNYLD